MYNRYTPQPDGSYRRSPMPEQPPRPAPEKKIPRPPVPQPRNPGGMGPQDLLVLFLLLAVSADSPKSHDTALLTLILYLLM